MCVWYTPVRTAIHSPSRYTPSASLMQNEWVYLMVRRNSMATPATRTAPTTACLPVLVGTIWCQQKSPQSKNCYPKRAGCPLAIRRLTNPQKDFGLAQLGLRPLLFFLVSALPNTQKL